MKEKKQEPDKYSIPDAVKHGSREYKEIMERCRQRGFEVKRVPID